MSAKASHFCNNQTQQGKKEWEKATTKKTATKNARSARKKCSIIKNIVSLQQPNIYIHIINVQGACVNGSARVSYYSKKQKEAGTKLIPHSTTNTKKESQKVHCERGGMCHLIKRYSRTKEKN